VKVHFVQVPATGTENAKGQERPFVSLRIEPPNVPVKLEKIKHDNVTGRAFAVPHAKSETMSASMGWYTLKLSVANGV
jgi:hypothetical protein